MTHDSGRGSSDEGDVAAVSAEDLRLTETQRKILVALCEPCTGESHYAPPATNQEIADQLFLSVDAIKAHLRVLYRKFGIEPLPHNQKRARLVELAMEGGVVTSAGEDPPGEHAAGKAAVASTLSDRQTPGAAPAQSSPGRFRLHRSPRLIIAAVAGGLAILAATAIAVRSGGGDQAEPAPSKSEYVATVQRFCRLALRSGEEGAGVTQQERALDYLRSIEVVRGPIKAEPPPAGEDPGLEQFRKGVNSAADLNGTVASAPEGEAPEHLAQLSAGLIIAAGNAQAGALKYGLGAPCASLGDLIGKSAENAAGPP